MVRSYCGDETDLIKYSGTSDSVPDFKNTISQVGSSANIKPPMTPQLHMNLYMNLYRVLYRVPYRVLYMKPYMNLHMKSENSDLQA